MLNIYQRNNLFLYYHGHPYVLNVIFLYNRYWKDLFITTLEQKLKVGLTVGTQNDC